MILAIDLWGTRFGLKQCHVHQLALLEAAHGLEFTKRSDCLVCIKEVEEKIEFFSTSRSIGSDKRFQLLIDALNGESPEASSDVEKMYFRAVFGKVHCIL